MGSPVVKEKTEIPAKKAKKAAKDSDDGDDDDDDDEEVIGVKGKRKISCIVDSDSDPDYVNDENESDNNQKMDIDEAPKRKKSTVTSVAKKKIKLDPDNSATTSFQSKLKKNSDQSSSLADVKETTDIIDVPTAYEHQSQGWLKPENIRDAEKRRPDHPKYDPTTLFVPNDYLDSLTPV